MRQLKDIFLRDEPEESSNMPRYLTSCDIGTGSPVRIAPVHMR